MSTFKSTWKSGPPLAILESYQLILSASDLSRPLKRQGNSSWWVEGGENQKYCTAQVQIWPSWPSWPSPDLHLTWTWTWAWQSHNNSYPKRSVTVQVDVEISASRNMTWVGSFPPHSPHMVTASLACVDWPEVCLRLKTPLRVNPSSMSFSGITSISLGQPPVFKANVHKILPSHSSKSKFISSPDKSSLKRWSNDAFFQISMLIKVKIVLTDLKSF